WAREAAVATTAWVAGFEFVEFEQDYEFVALAHPDEYAVVDGRIVSNRGLDLAAQEWGDVFEERHVEWSNALHAVIKERGAFMTGPNARYSLGFEKLYPVAQQAARKAGLGATCANPFKSIIVRAVEIVQACEEALRIIDRYVVPDRPMVTATPKAGVGHGVSEAPRGLCYHRYEFDADGIILNCQIVPPTSQNQLRIEEDLWSYVPQYVHLPDDELQWQLEQAIRNYDPCISCATHFLNLTVERG
ncbi:MAG: nickel-dependent hydrogenase large subunit, partial [Acidimicrobiia bacterium]